MSKQKQNKKQMSKPRLDPRRTRLVGKIEINTNVKKKRQNKIKTKTKSKQNNYIYFTIVNSRRFVSKTEFKNSFP